MPRVLFEFCFAGMVVDKNTRKKMDVPTMWSEELAGSVFEHQIFFQKILT